MASHLQLPFSKMFLSSSGDPDKDTAWCSGDKTQMMKLHDTRDYRTMQKLCLVTSTFPSSVPVSCAMFTTVTTETRSVRPPTFVLLYLFFSKPKHQSGLNFVCPGIMNDRVISSCWPVMTLQQVLYHSCFDPCGIMTDYGNTFCAIILRLVSCVYNTCALCIGLSRSLI